MSKLAFIFPGQGSQHAGMGRELATAFPIAKAVFDEADQALGFSLSNLCFEGPEADLQLTANTQPAILTASIAAYRVLAEKGVQPDFVAGHSLGEYSALVAAEALPLSEAVKLVRRRGEFMQVAVPVGLGAPAGFCAVCHLPNRSRRGGARMGFGASKLNHPSYLQGTMQIAVPSHRDYCYSRAVSGIPA